MLALFQHIADLKLLSVYYILAVIVTAVRTYSVWKLRLMALRTN